MSRARLLGNDCIRHRCTATDGGLSEEGLDSKGASRPHGAAPWGGPSADSWIATSCWGGTTPLEDPLQASACRCGEALCWAEDMAAAPEYHPSMLMEFEASPYKHRRCAILLTAFRLVDAFNLHTLEILEISEIRPFHLLFFW